MISLLLATFLMAGATSSNSPASRVVPKSFQTRMKEKKPPSMAAKARPRIPALPRVIFVETPGKQGTLAINLTAPDTPYVSDTFGAQKTLAVIVNLADMANTTKESDLPAIMGRVETYMKDASYGGLRAMPLTTATVQIAATAATFCGSGVWGVWANMTAVHTALTAKGIDWTTYQRQVFIHPHLDACGWCGNSSTGDDPSLAWIRDDCVSAQVIGHEIGHGFGLMHSHSDRCDAGVCTEDEYGDQFDIMGQATPEMYHFNAMQKHRLGWLDYKGSPKTVQVADSGVYQLASYEQKAGGGGLPKALRIIGLWNPRDNVRPVWWIVWQREKIILRVGGSIYSNGEFHEEDDDSVLKDLDPGVPVNYILGPDQSQDIGTAVITAKAGGSVVVTMAQ